MTFRGYDYYGKQVVMHALEEPDVDASDEDELMEYSDEMAELLVLTPTRLRDNVRAAAGYSKASERSRTNMAFQ